MNNWIRIMLALVLSVGAAQGAFAQEDAEGAKDNPYLSRMPGFHIGEQDDKQFDSYQFCDGKKLVSVEGHLQKTLYQRKEGQPDVSLLQVRRNYINAIKSLGGQVLLDGACEGFDDTRESQPLVVGKLLKGGREVWFEIFPWDNGGVQYQLTVVEKEAMTQDVTASDLLKALNAEGHVALYINFDTNKADIRPESVPILEQVVSMLKAEPSLNLSVEGHTDNSGAAAANKALSEARAKAVVSALVARGIGAGRLSAAGHGPDKPVAGNGTEEGRARNRRVELVKK